jgi:hypothetical protein
MEKKANKISKMRDEIAAYEKVKRRLSLSLFCLFNMQTHARGARNQEMMGKQGSSKEHLKTALVLQPAREELKERTMEVFGMGVCVSFTPAEGGEPVQGDYHEQKKTHPYHRTSIHTVINTTRTHVQPGKVNLLPPKGTVKYGVDVEGMTTYVLPTDLVLVPEAAIKHLGKRKRGTVGETNLVRFYLYKFLHFFAGDHR